MHLPVGKKVFAGRQVGDGQGSIGGKASKRRDGKSKLEEERWHNFGG